MVRVSDLDESLNFYCDGLGLQEIRRSEHQNGRFTLIFLAAPEDSGRAKEDQTPLIELTYNWDHEDFTAGRNIGHLAYRVENIYDVCTHLQAVGITINRPPRDGRMAFIKSPDGISIELLQKGEALTPRTHWQTMSNIGSW